MNLKRLKWGRSRRRPYAYQTHLHRYEEEVIARKLRQLHDRAEGLAYYTAYDLNNEFPGLFHIPLLKKALARTRENGVTGRSRSGWSKHRWAYALLEEVHRRGSKEAA